MSSPGSPSPCEAGRGAGERGALETEASPQLGVCIRDNAGAVVFQNASCREICGENVGVRCGGPCTVAGARGTLLTDQGRVLHGVRCDLWLHDSGTEAVTLLRRRDGLERELEELLSEYALTPREREVATAAALGRTNRQIARELGVTVATVRTHLNRAYQKLPPGSLARGR